jgi:hypothetical protein
MAGRFEVYVDKAGEHRFRLKASNGQIIMVSEGYKTSWGTRKVFQFQTWIQHLLLNTSYAMARR